MSTATFTPTFNAVIEPHPGESADSPDVEEEAERYEIPAAAPRATRQNAARGVKPDPDAAAVLKACEAQRAVQFHNDVAPVCEEAYDPQKLLIALGASFLTGVCVGVLVGYAFSSTTSD